MHLVRGSEARQSLSQIGFLWAGAAGCLFSGLVYPILLQEQHSDPFRKGGNPFAVRGSCGESAPAVGL